MWSGIFTCLLVLLIIGTMLIIIFDDGDSGRKIAWILIISVLPIIGLLLYFLVGMNFRHSWFLQQRRKKFKKIFDEKANDKTKELLFGHKYDNKVRKDYRPYTQLLSQNLSTTVCDGNSLEIIVSGHRKFELLMEDLKNAKHYIHMEYFYFRKDDGSMQIKQMLMQKAREGVKVRFIHENIANIAIAPGYYNEMKKAGVQVEKFTKPHLPFINLITQLNYRDHRKIVIIDGNIGYTGGMNISDDYFIRWRDTHLRITGNAVAGLQYSFLNTWITSGGKIDDDFDQYFPMCNGNSSSTDNNIAATFTESEIKNEEVETTQSAIAPETLGISENIAKSSIQNVDIPLKLAGKNKLVQIVPDEPDTQWPIIQMGAVWAVQHAKKYIYIQTPYFVPPGSMLMALKSAALSGIDVRIMVPKKADLFFMGPANKSFFNECLEAGIRIFERSGRFIHSKTFVSDDYLSEIGSANMDFRSFNLDYELNAYIFDEDTALINKSIFFKDLEACEEVTLADWESRPWRRKLLQRIIRLFAPLL
jgi:cardiolipin synthase